MICRQQPQSGSLSFWLYWIFLLPKWIGLTVDSWAVGGAVTPLLPISSYSLMPWAVAEALILYCPFAYVQRTDILNNSNKP